MGGTAHIHSELTKLGFQVSERTVSRYLSKRPARPDAVCSWKVFLKNHRDVLAAMDFFAIQRWAFECCMSGS